MSGKGKPRKTPKQGKKQSASPDCSPQDKPLPKKAESQGDAANKPKSFNPRQATPVELKMQLTLQQAKVLHISTQADSAAELVKAKKKELKEAEDNKKLLDFHRSENLELFRELVEIISNPESFKYGWMSQVDIRAEVSVENMDALSALTKTPLVIVLRTLIDGGINDNAAVLETVASLTEPELQTCIDAKVFVKGTKLVTEDKRLNHQVSKVRLVEALRLRIALLLGLECNDRAALFGGVGSPTQEGVTFINKYFVRKVTPGGDVHYGKIRERHATLGLTHNQMVAACVLPSANVAEVGKTVKYTKKAIEESFVDLPLGFGNKLKSLTIDHGTEQDALEALFETFCEYTETGVLPELTTVNYCSIFDNASSDAMFPVLATLTTECAPNLKSFAIKKCAVGAHLGLFRDLLQKVDYLNLTDAGLTSTADLLGLLAGREVSLKGLMLCRNNWCFETPDDRKACEASLKKFTSLEAFAFGGLKSTGQNDLQAQRDMVTTFAKGLMSLKAEQFRFLELVEFDICEVSFILFGKWLSAAEHLQLFRLVLAEMSSWQVAAIFRGLVAIRANLRSVDFSDIPIFNEKDDSEGWPAVVRDAFMKFGSNFPNRLTHLKLEGLRMTDEDLLSCLTNVPKESTTPTQLKKLSLKDNESLTLAAAQAIVSVASRFPSLEIVDLSGTGINAHQFEEVYALFESIPDRKLKVVLGDDERIRLGRNVGSERLLWNLVVVAPK